MIRDIVKSISLLSKPCKPVTDVKELRGVVNDLYHTFKQHQPKGGVGLSANQIGYDIQVAYVETKTLRLWLINPKIVLKEQKIAFNEACLSLPGIGVKTGRWNSITIVTGLEKYETQNRDEFHIEGFDAIVVQHEIDHLMGRTILDRKWRAK